MKSTIAVVDEIEEERDGPLAELSLNLVASTHYLYN